MRFGVNTLIWSVSFDPAATPLRALKEASVDGIEVPNFAPAEFDPVPLRKALADYGFACTMCSVSPPGASPISDDAGEREAGLEHWRRVIAGAGEAGVEALAGPSFSPVGYLPGRRRTEGEWKRAVEFHQTLGESLDEAGIDFAIEPLNRFETYFLNTAADAAKLCDEINHPRVGILLDSFHANIEEKSIPAAYRSCGKHLKHVHTCENDRGIPGSGHVDWLETLKTLKEVGYDRWLTIESFNAAMPEIAAAAAIWRDLAPHTDDIAVKGIQFLRGLWNTIER